MSKSERTRRRHKRAWKGQTTLDSYIFKKDRPTLNLPQSATPLIHSEDTTNDDTNSLSSSSAREDSSAALDMADIADLSATEAEEELMDNDEREDWEEELDVAIKGRNEIRDWQTLRNQINDDLKKHQASLPLTRINQLVILRNFATLRLKGLSRTGASEEIAHQWRMGSGAWFARRVRALARHYQIFEQLPHEKHGGSANAQSFLHDESVQARCRTWLATVPIGKVTPRALQHALQTTIFPGLGIMPKHPISEQTARRWLVKLGWRHTVIRRGVHMDGHERDDVVKYRNEVYLPAMQKFER
jgi:hypothetical protein